MSRRLSLMLVFLVMMAVGVKPMPCAGMAQIHDCCVEKLQASFSEPYTRCCGEDAPVLPQVAPSSVFKQATESMAWVCVEAFSDRRVADLHFSVFQNHEHWGGAPKVPVYLNISSLLL